jgi:hypothetical protein
MERDAALGKPTLYEFLFCKPYADISKFGYVLLTGKLAPWVLDTRHGAEVLCGDAQESSDLAGDPHDGPDLACHPHHAGVPALPPPQGAGQASHPAPVWLHLPLLQVNLASTGSSTILDPELRDAQFSRLH